jgi:hypothetical protein
MKAFAMAVLVLVSLSASGCAGVSGAAQGQLFGAVLQKTLGAIPYSDPEQAAKLEREEAASYEKFCTTLPRNETLIIYCNRLAPKYEKAAESATNK